MPKSYMHVTAMLVTGKDDDLVKFITDLGKGKVSPYVKQAIREKMLREAIGRAKNEA